MIRITKLVAIAGLSVWAGVSGPVARAQDASSREVLWYRTSAPVWDHALPIANGRLGAMVFGGANAGSNNGDLQASPKNASLIDGSQTSGVDEHLQLNESSLWKGGRTDRLNPRAHEAVPEIRKLLLESKGLDGEKIAAAEKMAQEDMIGIPPVMPGYSTLGDLYLLAQKHGTISDYRQELYFQFARYLLISSSRADGLPANLQGIWASGIDNPWGSKYTININTEMNYWLAEPAGLGSGIRSGRYSLVAFRAAIRFCLRTEPPDGVTGGILHCLPEWRCL